MGAKQRGTGRDMAPRPRLGVPCRDRSRWRGGSRQCRGGEGSASQGAWPLPPSCLPDQGGFAPRCLPLTRSPPDRHASFVSVFKMNDY